MDLFNTLRANVAELPAGLILPAVFVLALISSIHCIGMCGVFCLAGSSGVKRNSWLYQVGRLFAYLMLGSLMAFVGKEFLYQLQPALVFTFVLILVFILSFKSKYLAKFYQSLYKPNHYLLQRAKELNTNLRALLVGASSGLLPCGLLYTFLFAALAVQSFVLGVAIIFVFWLGTVPALQSLVYFKDKSIWLQKLQSTRWNFVVLGFFIIYSLAVSSHRFDKLPDATTKPSEALLCF